MADSPFRLIEGGKPEKPKRQSRRRVLTPWECRTCEVDIGVRSRVLVKVRQGAFQDQQLRVSGGSDAWVCAMCLSRGKYTPVTA